MSYYTNMCVLNENSVKRSDVTENFFEWLLGENNVIKISLSHN